MNMELQYIFMNENYKICVAATYLLAIVGLTIIFTLLFCLGGSLLLLLW